MNKYLNIDEQISFLKNNNVDFKNVTVNEAKNILQNEVYLHKILQYKLLFEDRNMIFSDLYETYLIDKILREILNDILLEVEFNFKLFVVSYVGSNPKIDEYFLDEVSNIESRYQLNNRIEKRIRDFNDVYSKHNLEKYPDLKPVWVINEYLSFGEMLDLFDRYLHKNNINKYEQYMQMMKVCKNVRNTVAHGNTIFYGFYEEKNEIDLVKLFKQEFNIELKVKNMSSSFIYNVLNVLYVYKYTSNEEICNERFDYLYMKLHRFSKQYDLYRRNPNLNFVRDLHYLYKVVNKMY